MNFCLDTDVVGCRVDGHVDMVGMSVQDEWVCGVRGVVNRGTRWVKWNFKQ